MTPLPSSPKIVLLYDSIAKEVKAVATNISSETEVVVVETYYEFMEKAEGQPFNSSRQN